MLVSLDWLKEYVKVDSKINDFCDKMIMSGSNLETAEKLVDTIENVVVAKIEKIEKHPNADKLVVCQLNIGRDELVQVVTGAPNVFEGAHVVFAMDGSRIPGPLHGQPKKKDGEVIKAGELRGIKSYGMLCSFSELGFSDKVIPTNAKDGVWILEDGLKLGENIVSELGLSDYVIDFEITSNRPDCLSMIGMAREASVVFQEKLEYPQVACKKEVEDVSEYAKISILNKEKCSRYCARVVKNVRIQDSPWSLKKKLIASGVRPINNIVDITNFVMLEYGQPLHAFDLNNLENKEIRVEAAENGEEFVTLDGNTRLLDSNDLLIKDGKKAVALAGIMGGLNSEITENTETILIESANFNADSIRASSKKLGLRTEASSRFEKGVDANLCDVAVNRVCQLIEQLGAGEVVKGILDEGEYSKESAKIIVRPDRINKVLGTNISKEQMVEIFTGLEIKCEYKGEDIEVQPPTVRIDLNIEEDYIEEVARIYGYDKLPMSVPRGNSESIVTPERALRDLARETLCALGLNEISTYSFCSPRSVDKLRIDEDSWERHFVRLLNPLGEETSVMRTILTPNMMEVLATNYRRKIKDAMAFEIGNTFMADLVQDENLPTEEYAISIGMYGENVDFFTLKGTISEFLKVMGIRNPDFIAESEYGPYHPGRCARIVSGDIELGIMGEIHPEVSENYEISTRVYTAELFFDNIMAKSDKKIVYKPLPKYPSTSRDIALVVDEAIEVAQIENTIKDGAENSEILQSIELFDIYRGAQVEQNKKSMAFTLTYRSDDYTLKEEEVAVVHENILKALSEKIGAKLREI